MTRILITGSRDWTDENAVAEALRDVWMGLGSDPDAIIVHGGASGADTLAGKAAAAMGLAVESHPADWKRHGKKAAPLRNAEMVDLGADVCVAFPLGTSKGTWGCVKLAEAAGIPVRIIRKRVGGDTRNA